MKFSLYPHQDSKGGRALVHALGGKVIKRRGSKFKGSKGRVVVNWGCSEIDNPEVFKCGLVLNNPKDIDIAAATNKLTFFRAMEDCDAVPEFVTTMKEAVAAMARKKDPWSAVVCRTVLQGHSGRGIVIANDPAELVEAPLYVRYIKKEEEFRAHVVGDSMIDVQRKARRHDVPDEQVNWKVRSWENGFVYAREGMDDHPLRARIEELAVTAVEMLALDFGAVDIIYNRKGNMLYALEINTAPGLEGQTVENYAKAFREFV